MLPNGSYGSAHARRDETAQRDERDFVACVGVLQPPSPGPEWRGANLDETMASLIRARHTPPAFLMNLVRVPDASLGASHRLPIRGLTRGRYTPIFLFGLVGACRG